jgi:glutathione synthase
LVRALQKVELKNVVSELGIYGYLIGDGEDLTVKRNETGGHILRSKLEHETKGGVAIGAAVIDTPFLI